MIIRVLSAELLKIRKKMIWFLTVLGPLGVIGLQAVNFGLRYDYMTQQYRADLWGGLIGNVGMLLVPTLFIGLAIIASMTASIEHQTNAWKQLLALPVTRTQIFLGKFLLSAVLLAVSSTLIVVGTIVLGCLLGFPLADVPFSKLLVQTYYPYLAIMPFLALQVWMSVTLHNQAWPLTVGISGTVVSLFATRLQDWIPYKWPYLVNAADNPLHSAVSGLLLASVLLAAGVYAFVRKDVK